jgi:alginate O-acetyltransferase complex protein AlgI
MLGLWCNRTLIGSLKIQNYLLLISSYIFYGYWDWRFLILIIFCTLQAYYLAGAMSDKEDSKFRNTRLLWISVLLNLAILGYFKYANFFYAEAANLFKQFGYAGSTSTLNILLPVGISFYIFQSLTYIIDVYRGQLKKEPSLVNYATYIAFFPQLVAGPIERAANLLPQFTSLRQVTEKQIYQGVRLIIFGLFLKVVIADSLAAVVDDIFAWYENFNGGVHALGAIYFAVQIYGDFCGYSMIAIGAANCMGFRLMTNFDTPYFSCSIQEFWRRWHISLSSFFRDYLYIPLGGSRVSEAKILRNLILAATISGLWHGANWTFIVWGFLHGVLLVIQRKLNQYLSIPESITKQGITGFLFKISSWALTFSLVALLLVVFRSETVLDAFVYIKEIFFHFKMPDYHVKSLSFVFMMFVGDWILLKNNRLEKNITNSKVLDYLVFTILTLLTIDAFVVNNSRDFIYFQF